MKRDHRRTAAHAETRLCRFAGCDDDALPEAEGMPLCALHRSLLEELHLRPDSGETVVELPLLPG